MFWCIAGCSSCQHGQHAVVQCPSASHIYLAVRLQALLGTRNACYGSYKVVALLARRSGATLSARGGASMLRKPCATAMGWATAHLNLTCCGILQLEVAMHSGLHSTTTNNGTISSLRTLCKVASHSQLVIVSALAIHQRLLFVMSWLHPWSGTGVILGVCCCR